MKQVQYLSSELLTKIGVTHGWFMRFGGVSSGAFESLNGKKGAGDSDLHVDENRALAAALLSDSQTMLAHIVHSFEANVLTADAPGDFVGYDASITSRKGLLLSQTTADCGSVIIADTKGQVVSLVHGSWHTLRDKIICKTVAKLKEHTKSELIAGLGPMICQDCYEFGPEAITLFEPIYVRHSVMGNKLAPTKYAEGIKYATTYHVSLKQMILDQLKESNVTQIDDVAICTKEDERFFSHRRSGARSGRFLTLASLT